MVPGNTILNAKLPIYLDRLFVVTHKIIPSSPLPVHINLYFSSNVANMESRLSNFLFDVPKRDTFNAAMGDMKSFPEFLCCLWPCQVQEGVMCLNSP